MVSTEEITHRVYARIGLLGNPSDGFNGKTIALSLKNFYAEVTLTPASGVEFVRHPIHDRRDYPSLEQFVKNVESQGYYGGVRLMMCRQPARNFWSTAPHTG